MRRTLIFLIALVLSGGVAHAKKPRTEAEQAARQIVKQANYMCAKRTVGSMYVCVHLEQDAGVRLQERMWTVEGPAGTRLRFCYAEHVTNAKYPSFREAENCYLRSN